MSVDLVGSTAFKANKKHAEPQISDPSPAWVREFRTFYKNFPIAVYRAHDLVAKSSSDGSPEDIGSRPRVWKTIGDEIVFCCRVRRIEHVAASVSAFLKALEHYTNGPFN